MAANADGNDQPLPIAVVLSCHMCLATLDDIYAAAEGDKGFRDSSGTAKERVVPKLWMTECYHLTCSKHLVSNGVPFHRAAQHPMAPCPICVNETADSTPKKLFAVSGYNKGQYDEEIPAAFFNIPPMDFQGGYDMNAICFQYMSLIRYSTKVSVRLRDVENENATLKQHRPNKEAQATIDDLQARLSYWDDHKDDITKYLCVLPKVVAENSVLRQTLESSYAASKGTVSHDVVPERDPFSRGLCSPVVAQTPTTARGRTAVTQGQQDTHSAGSSPLFPAPGQIFDPLLFNEPEELQSDFPLFDQRDNANGSGTTSVEMEYQEIDNGRRQMPPPPAPYQHNIVLNGVQATDFTTSDLVEVDRNQSRVNSGASVHGCDLLLQKDASWQPWTEAPMSTVDPSLLTRKTPPARGVSHVSDSEKSTSKNRNRGLPSTKFDNGTSTAGYVFTPLEYDGETKSFTGPAYSSNGSAAYKAGGAGSSIPVDRFSKKDASLPGKRQSSAKAYGSDKFSTPSPPKRSLLVDNASSPFFPGRQASQHKGRMGLPQQSPAASKPITGTKRRAEGQMPYGSSKEKRMRSQEQSGKTISSGSGGGGQYGQLVNPSTPRYNNDCSIGRPAVHPTQSQYFRTQKGCSFIPERGTSGPMASSAGYGDWSLQGGLPSGGVSAGRRSSSPRKRLPFEFGLSPTDALESEDYELGDYLGRNEA